MRVVAQPVESVCPLGETLFGGPRAGDMDRLAGDGAGAGLESPGEATLAAADEVAPVTEVTDEVTDEVAVVDGLPLFLALAFDGGASAPADSDAPFALAASCTVVVGVDDADDAGVADDAAREYLCCCEPADGAGGNPYDDDDDDDGAGGGSGAGAG